LNVGQGTSDGSATDRPGRYRSGLSVLLYATLGSGEAFTNARQFSACLGLTPKQFSSGGKVILVGISRQVAHRRLRAALIQGARAYVYRLKEPKTAKDHWLWAIIERTSPSTHRGAGVRIH